VQAVPVAYIVGVNAGSPAERAGLAVGDLIVAVNGEGLRQHQELHAFLSDLREAAMLSRAVVEILKYDPVTDSYSESRVEPTLPARARARLGLSAGFEILITHVPDGGAAARAGLRPGEFIDAINGRGIAEMRSVLDVDLSLARARESGDVVPLTLRRWKLLPPIEGEAQRLTYTEREVRVDLRSLQATAGPPRP